MAYSYFTDNEEEIEMEAVLIDDYYYDQSEVSLSKTVRGYAVALDFDPHNYEDGQTLMQYSPDQARKLAAALTLAADEAERK